MKNKWKILSIGIILLVLGFQYYIVLEEQKTPPSEQWSRSFPSSVSVGDYAKLQVVPTEESYAVSLLNFKRMDFLECSEDMQCTERWTNSELDPYKNTWSDGETTYTINREDSLIRSSTAGGNDTLASDVENFTISGDTLVYWQTDQQITIQKGDQKPVSHTSKFPVVGVMIENEQIFIVTQNLQENLFTVLDGTNDLMELFHFGLNSTESLSAMYISADLDGGFKFLLDTIMTSGGSAVKMIRNASFDLTANQTPEFTELTFVDSKTGTPISDVRHPSLFKGEMGIMITFAANMDDVTGKKVNKVFTGPYDDSVIEASAVTKSGDFYVNPVYVNAETIAYFKLLGNQKQLMYSSSTDAKRAQSSDTQEGDIKEALYSLIGLLFNGLILVLLSFSWLIPALFIGYIVMAVLQKSSNRFAYPITLYMNALVLVASQITLFLMVFNPERIVLRAPYLTEVWHVAVAIAIAGILSVLPVLLSRTKVTIDNFTLLILFTTGLNLFVLFVLLGPYFL